MTTSEPELAKLAAELEAAYSVVIYAVPLALRAIQAGNAPLDEQQWFWYSIRDLSEHVDVLDELNDLDDKDPLDHALIERRDEVGRLNGHC